MSNTTDITNAAIGTEVLDFLDSAEWISEKAELVAEGYALRTVLAQIEETLIDAAAASLPPSVRDDECGCRKALQTRYRERWAEDVAAAVMLA